MDSNDLKRAADAAGLSPAERSLMNYMIAHPKATSEGIAVACNISRERQPAVLRALSFKLGRLAAKADKAPPRTCLDVSAGQ